MITSQVAASHPKSKDDTTPDKTTAEAQRPKCPVCAYPVNDSDPVTCPRCDTPHHRDCWEYTGGCSMFGCDADRWVPALRDDRAFRALKSRIDLWLYFYQASWGAFGIIAIMTAATLPLAVLSLSFLFLYSLLSAALRIPGIHTVLPDLIPMVIFPIWVTMLLAAVFVYVTSFPVYAMTVLPAALMRRRLERDLNNRLSIPGTSPRSLADRLELPWLGKTFSIFMSNLSSMVRLAMFFTLAAIPVTATMGEWRLTNSCVWILLVLLLILRGALPAITSALERRGTYLATLQHRAAAMLRKGKKG